MIDKERFLKASLPEGTVDLDGQTVTVRGLSRTEVVDLQAHKDDLANLERGILEAGFVDPPMSAADVAAWYGSAPAGDIDTVIEKIRDLSGMSPAAAKSGVPGLRDEPRP